MAIWLPGRQKLWCMSSNGGNSVANAHLSPPWPAHPPQRCRRPRRRRRRLGWTFGNIIENFYRKLCWRCSSATAAAQWQQKQTYCSLPAAKTRIKHYSPFFFVSKVLFQLRPQTPTPSASPPTRPSHPTSPTKWAAVHIFSGKFSSTSPTARGQQVDKVKKDPQWQETNESIMRSPAQRTQNLIYFVFVYYHKICKLSSK